MPSYNTNFTLQLKRGVARAHQRILKRGDLFCCRLILRQMRSDPPPIEQLKMTTTELAQYFGVAFVLERHTW